MGKSWNQNKVRNEMVCRLICFDEIMRKRERAGEAPTQLPPTQLPPTQLPPTQLPPDMNPAPQQQQRHRGGKDDDYNNNKSTTEGDARSNNNDLLQKVGSAIRQLGGVIRSTTLRAAGEQSDKDKRPGVGGTASLGFPVPNIRLPGWAG